MPHPLAAEHVQPTDQIVSDTDAAKHLQDLPGWDQEGGSIVKSFMFENHCEVVTFVNAVAWVTQRQNHHPDVMLGYNQVTVRYTSHAAGGLTRNDLICAAKVEALFEL